MGCGCGCGDRVWYWPDQQKLACSGPVKRYRPMQLARGACELYRVRVVNQLDVLLRMRINNAEGFAL